MNAVLRWASEALGWAPQSVVDVSWPHAASNVSRLEGPGGERAFLKIHAQSRKYLQELQALQRWGSQLPRTPRLIAARSEAPQALLLSEVPGAVIETTPLAATDRLEAQRQAGRWLRRLHALPHHDDDRALAGAVAERLQRWSERAAPHLPARVISEVADRVRSVDLSGLTRVPTHRDYGPRNWLWDAQERQLGVIDFEHALPDLWWVDVNRLVDEAWWGDPELEGAFWEGYGRMPSARERELGEAWRGMTALGTIAWARAHNDEPFAAQGLRVLDRLGLLG